MSDVSPLLVQVLGDRVEAAIAFLMSIGQERDTAIGHLEGLIAGKGQFNAAMDGGLADAFPEVFAAHQAALGFAPGAGEGIGEAPLPEHIQDGTGLGLASGEAPSPDSAT